MNKLKENKETVIVVGIFIVIMFIFCILVSMTVKKQVISVNVGGIEVEIVDGGSGLYVDQYINNRYIYRGNNPKNFVKFNNELWRIVSIDDDGNIQIMRDDVLDDRVFDSKGVRDINSSNPAGSYCEDAYDGCNAWAANENIVGKPKKIMNGSFTGEVTRDSEVLVYLNSEYLNTLPLKNIISYNWNIGGADLYDTMKQLIYTEGSVKWNGKVGLITASDYLKATTSKKCDTIENMGLNYVSCTENNWMYKEGKTWMTVSSHLDSTTYLWYIGDEGYMNGMPANEAHGVRPIIYLSSDVVFNGDGSEEKPYTIS